MRTSRLCVGIGSVVALLSLFTIVRSDVSAQADPHVGTWTLNVATSVYSMAGQGIKVATKGGSRRQAHDD